MPATGTATTRAFAMQRSPQPSMPGYLGVYLMCLPRSLMQRWIEQMRVDHPTTEYLDAETATLGTPDADITTIIDVAEHLDRRQRAIEAHASQTSPFEDLPNDLRFAFLAAVHARRVEPRWPGGDPETNLFS